MINTEPSSLMNRCDQMQQQLSMLPITSELILQQDPLKEEGEEIPIDISDQF